MNLKKMISFSYKNLRRIGLAVLVLPVIIFLFFFVKRIISVPVIAVLILAYYLATRNKENDDRYFDIEVKQLALILLVCIAWCYFGGQGGFFYQTSDWNERNAIFRDLMTNKWPVYYPKTDTALTYYIGHWLPAALIGRTFYTLTGLWDAAWILGNVCLWIWTVLSLFWSVLLLFQYVAASTKRMQWLVLIILIGFSGLDIVGCILQGWKFQDFAKILHIEWWIVDYQFSSITTCLFWVYNQAIPAWIATLLFLNEKSNKMYALIITCTLMSAPLPCVGLAVYMVGHAIFKLVKSIKQHTVKAYIKETLSLVNIISTIFVFPILGFYFLTNSALEKSGVIQRESLQFNNYVIYLGCLVGLLALIQLLLRKKNAELFVLSIMSLAVAVVLLLNPQLGFEYILFLLLEVGVYLVVIANEKYKCDLFYLTMALFVFAPVIKIGIGADFCMRATVPAVIIVMTMCIDALKKWVVAKNQNADIALKNKIMYMILVTALIIGMFTPAMEFYRGIYKVTEGQRLNLVADDIYTLNQYHSSGGIYGNFVSESYKDSIFFKYLAQE